jgi:hypothetical protein
VTPPWDGPPRQVWVGPALIGVGRSPACLLRKANANGWSVLITANSVGTVSPSDRQVAVGALRRWGALTGAGLGLVATCLLAAENPLAAAGVVLVGLGALWLLLDFSVGATALFTASLLIPSGVSLYFGTALPLLTFQRAMLVLLVGCAIIHNAPGFLSALWRTPHIRLLLTMIAVLAVSTVFSSQPELSRREFFSERVIGLPLYFAVVCFALPNRAAVRRLLLAFCAIGFVILVLALVEAVTGNSIVASLHLLPPEKLKELGYGMALERRAGLPRVHAVFQHPLELGAFLVAYIPLVAVFRRYAGSTGRRWFWSVTLVLALVGLLCTWSQGAWIALLFAVLLMRSGGGRRWIVVMIGIAVFVIVWSRLGFLHASRASYRWWLVSSVARAMWGHYGLGTGPGTFVRMLAVRIAGTSETTVADPLAYSLTMALEGGPLFVVLFWWFMLRVLGRAERARNLAAQNGRGESAALLDALRAGLWANLFLSAISYSLFGTTGGLFTAFMLLGATVTLSHFERVKS